MRKTGDIVGIGRFTVAIAVGTALMMGRFLVRVVGIGKVTEVQRLRPVGMSIRLCLDDLTVEQEERIPLVDRTAEVLGTGLNRFEPLGVRQLFIRQIVEVGRVCPEQVRRGVRTVAGVDGCGIRHFARITAAFATAGVRRSRYVVLAVFNGKRKGNACGISGQVQMHICSAVPHQLCLGVVRDGNITAAADAAPLRAAFFGDHLEVDAAGIDRDRDRAAGTAVDLIRRGSSGRPAVHRTGYKPVADRGVSRKRGRRDHDRKGRQNQQNCQNNR